MTPPTPPFLQDIPAATYIYIPTGMETGRWTLREWEEPKRRFVLTLVLFLSALSSEISSSFSSSCSRQAFSSLVRAANS